MRAALICLAIIAACCFAQCRLDTDAHAAASIVPAYGTYSCATGKACTGPRLNSGKQGTNSAYWGGSNGITVGFDKAGGSSNITISTQPPLSIDATSGNQTQDIAAYSKVTVCKSDSTANTVTITDSTPRTIPLGPLTVQGECWELSLAAGIWYAR